MKMDEVSVMTSMQPHEADYVDRWTNVAQPVKDDMVVTTQLQNQVNSDVISMQYMELEEFLLENSVPDGTGKVFIDNTNSQLPEKHYHVSLEQRGLVPGGGGVNHPYATDLSSGGNNNVHLLNIHNHHHHHQHQHDQSLPLHHQQQQQQQLHDPNSPPQSSCDSPPSSRQLHHSPRSNGNSNNQGISLNQLSNSTARKSLPRRVSTSSNASSLVVTPPHTPQEPSPPNSDVSSTPERVKSKRAVKRSRKESVPDDSKDEKYWKRRAKNNAAAKRSRDLRREKENHIMQRVAFLEKENRILHQEMDSIKMENEELKERLAHFEIKTL